MSATRIVQFQDVALYRRSALEETRDVISFGGTRNRTTGDCRLEITTKWLRYVRGSASTFVKFGSHAE
jgi:hypothetical protein